MNVVALLTRWLDVLAALFSEWWSKWRARQSIVVARDDGRLTLRQRYRDGKLGAIMPVVSSLPGELAKTVKQAFVVFEMPEREIVIRTIKVPAQARDFLSGIVRNQIDRLSPWPPQEAIYGFEAHPSTTDPGSLEVQISIASRGTVESTRDELRSIGLPLDQITVRKTNAPDRPPIPLWSRDASAGAQQIRTARFAVGGALAATVLLSAVISAWALWSATLIASDLDDTTTRSRTLQRLLQVGRSPQALAALPLPERAWAFKETSYSAVFALEALSRALPDTAYLTDFRLEKGILRITGLTNDAPTLIAPLEQSGHFTNVRFSAATTRSAESGLFNFNIEASQERRLSFAGK
jgi:general secretion pathway protein L